jgi:hypothetical protein
MARMPEPGRAAGGLYGMPTVKLSRGTLALLLLLAVIVVAIVAAAIGLFDTSSGSRSAQVMLILRGIASDDRPRGQLDDPAALAYARELGYAGEVLDVAGDGGGAQVRMALERIRRDPGVAALYAFSGGGYNARRVWQQLSSEERERIRKIVIVGSPGIEASDFPGDAEVVVRRDPPAGHMAGPRALLEEERGE